MKSLKEQLNTAIYQSKGLRRLSSVELSALKGCLIDMYRHVHALCESNGLLLILTGGSCLGAIRHNGFIPWDDDLDLMMPRSDYNKLLNLCESGKLGDEYEFTYPSPKHDAPCAFLKIYYKESRIIGLGGESEKYPNGVFIDIFPIEGAPTSRIVRRLKGWFADTLRLCANMVDCRWKWSTEESAIYKQDKSLYFNMKCRQIIGRILSVINHKTWICWYDSFVKNDCIDAVAVIPTGRKLYYGESLAASVYLPPSKGVFEGMEVNLPADPETYLKNLYGEYMSIPPVDKRESHFIRRLDLPEKYYHCL